MLNTQTDLNSFFDWNAFEDELQGLIEEACSGDDAPGAGKPAERVTDFILDRIDLRRKYSLDGVAPATGASLFALAVHAAAALLIRERRFSEVTQLSTVVIDRHFGTASTELMRCETPSAVKCRRAIFDAGVQLLSALVLTQEQLELYGYKILDRDTAALVWASIARLAPRTGTSAGPKLRLEAEIEPLVHQITKLTCRCDVDLEDGWKKIIIGQCQFKYAYCLSYLNVLKTRQICRDTNRQAREDFAQRIFRELASGRIRSTLRNAKWSCAAPKWLWPLVRASKAVSGRPRNLTPLNARLMNRYFGVLGTLEAYSAEFDATEQQSVILAVLRQTSFGKCIATSFTNYCDALARLFLCEVSRDPAIQDAFEDAVASLNSRLHSHFLEDRRCVFAAVRLFISIGAHTELRALTRALGESLADRAAPWTAAHLRWASDNCSEEDFDRILGYAARAFEGTSQVRSASERAQLTALGDTIRRFSFIQSSRKLLQDQTSIEGGNGFVFVLTFASDTFELSLPLCLEAKRKGYRVGYVSTQVGVSEQRVPETWDIREEVCSADRLRETLCSGDATALMDEICNFFSNDQVHLRTGPKTHDGFFNEVVADWQEYAIDIDGVNCYQGIAEYLRNFYRTPEFRYATLSTRDYARTQLHRADATIAVCKLIERLSVVTGKPSFIVATQAQSAPAQAAMAFCATRGYRSKVQFVSISPGYENYSSSTSKLQSSTISAANLTATPFRRAPILATPKLFSEWAAAQPAGDDEDQVDRILKMNRTGTSRADSEVQRLVDHLNEQKAGGRKILCMFGKVLTDLGVSTDGGPAHVDQLDWIRHTTGITTDNAVVLVKPHPHEANRSITRYPVTSMRNYIAPDGNAIYLESNWFNLHQLVEFIDLAVLWNGSSSLELLAQGCPVLMCSFAGRFDYPVGMTYPDNRADYERLIRNPPSLTVSQATRRKAKQLIRMQTSAGPLSVPQPYTSIKLTNDPIDLKTLTDDQVSTLQAGRDADIVGLFKEVFEKSAGLDENTPERETFRRLQREAYKRSIRSGAEDINKTFDELGII